MQSHFPLRVLFQSFIAAVFLLLAIQDGHAGDLPGFAQAPVPPPPPIDGRIVLPGEAQQQSLGGQAPEAQPLPMDSSGQPILIGQPPSPPISDSVIHGSGSSGPPTLDPLLQELPSLPHDLPPIPAEGELLLPEDLRKGPPDFLEDDR